MLILGDAIHAEDVECVNLALGGSNAIDARSADRREAQPALCPAHMPGRGPRYQRRRHSARRAHGMHRCAPIPSGPAGMPASAFLLWLS